MSAVKSIFKVLLSPLGAAAGLFSSKKPQAQAPLPQTGRNEAAERAAAADNLARRTGARGTRRLAAGGAEAKNSVRTSLLGRSG